jgi:hypothetical protein
MRVILKDFLWAYTLLGRRIVIISDMARKEKDAMNFTAGADVLRYIYNKLGYSNKGFIYTTSLSRAVSAIKIREVRSNNYKICTVKSQLV